MKRSKLFLGISTLLLAIVGIAATRANSKFTMYDYITNFNGAAVCHNGIASCGGTNAKCTSVVTSGGTSETVTLYTTTNASCGHILNTHL